MSVDSVLDGAFSLLLAKAQRESLDAPRQTHKPAVAHFTWTGGGAGIVLANCDPVLVEVPFPSSIVWAHLYAFRVNVVAGALTIVPVAVTATVDVLLTSLASFGAASPLRGAGAAPALVAQSTSTTDLTDWQTELIPGDTLVAAPTAFSGLAPVLVLTLLLRPTGSDIGVSDVVDGANGAIVDANGNPVVLRS